MSLCGTVAIADQISEEKAAAYKMKCKIKHLLHEHTNFKKKKKRILLIKIEIRTNSKLQFAGWNAEARRIHYQK